MKQIHTRLVIVPVRVTVEFNAEEGLYYATAPRYNDTGRAGTETVRSGDKETAIAEAIISAGYGAPTEKRG
jgi:hypothetical protein